MCSQESWGNLFWNLSQKCRSAGALVSKRWYHSRHSNLQQCKRVKNSKLENWCSIDNSVSISRQTLFLYFDHASQLCWTAKSEQIWKNFLWMMFQSISFLIIFPCDITWKWNLNGVSLSQSWAWHILKLFTHTTSLVEESENVWQMLNAAVPFEAMNNSILTQRPKFLLVWT